ncbi:MAG: ABC transporter permease subunit [Actinomycetia bacterium]|nr:ABC transporter permease subunit [Actinomycetes bacterium]
MTGLAITGRSLRDRRGSLIWWAVGIFLYTAMIMAVWPVIEDNKEFEELAKSYPEALKAMMGGPDAFDAFTTPAGFLDTYLYSMILPFILVGLAVAMGAALLGGDEEDGKLELLLSYPVTRTSAVGQKALAMTTAVVAIAALVVLLIFAVGSLVDLDVGIAGLLSATLGTALFALLHGQIAMLGGAVLGRRGVALGVGWGVALGGYLLNVLSGIDSSLSWLRWLSPLHYATANTPLNNGPPVEYLALLAALVLATTATLVAFRRHDLR